MPRFRSFGFSLALLVCVVVTGCGGTLPRVQATSSSPDAQRLYEATLQAHGQSALQNLRNVNVSYDGKWRDLVTRFQPVLIDRAFRGTSEERIDLRSGVTAQLHRGSGGVKYVYRDSSSVRVWYNGAVETDPEKIAAAAFVADGYRMFLLGPFYFLEKKTVLAHGGETSVDGERCEVLLVRASPGFGDSKEDDYALYIDKKTRLMRRLRFTARGLESLQGVVADVDFFDYRNVNGVWWPTRFFERLRKPLPLLPVHEWRVTGLDVNRDYDLGALKGPDLLGNAASPAASLSTSKP